MTDLSLMKIIGNNIRNARITKGMKIDDLANVLGVSAGYVGLIERGKRGTTASTLKKISTVFDVPIGDFFAEEGFILSESGTPRHELIRSLTVDFADPELDFVISIIRNYRAMRGNISYSEDDDK
ncbi:MAG: helix-turn-helix domain-containing protein [Clostridiales bacterium]|nr:helix-turn-helix domain-containing protein [Clostridiales bacterium]